MGKDAEGRSVYLNVWPKVLDIEKKVYKPVLLRVIPFIGALFARTVGSLVPFIASLGYRCFMSIRPKKSEPTHDLEHARTFMENLHTKSGARIDKAIAFAEKSFGPHTEHSSSRWENWQARLSLYLEHAVEECKKSFASLLGSLQTIKQEVQERFRNDLTQAIFSSLAYSMLVFLVGFAAVLFIR